MELRVLRYILAVAKEETNSVAADQLHLTQPTLSRQLMELEEELGSKLFIRGRRLTLTESGALFCKRAQEIVELADRFKAKFSVHDTAVSGDVHIGGGETHGMRLVVEVAMNFRQTYPLVNYPVHSGNAEVVTERARQGTSRFRADDRASGPEEVLFHPMSPT
ncbi:MAG: LysR family transcriptional regulator [Deltaproteobacteria bacterium]|jgi:DNA-binding transcriptional LysR family regulator|nr:LysR family transcriptional regulator [Deltaproteobacteria bacterium]